MKILRITTILTAIMAVFVAGRLSSADMSLREKSIAERDRKLEESRNKQNMELVLRKKKSAETFIATASRMMGESSDAAVVELVKNAGFMKALADEDIRSEDYVQASSKLSTSINSSLQAIALLVKGEYIRNMAIKELEAEYAERKKKLYGDIIDRKRTESEVFIETVRRLLKEADNNHAAGFLKDSIDMKETAEQYIAAGEFEKAIESLNNSFSLAVKAVKSIRDDRVVVHKINFSTLEEEFMYEKENNETYLLMAVSVVRDGTENARKKINEARELRSKSDGAAVLKNYSGALMDMKSSNGLLIRTIEECNSVAGKNRK